MILPKPKLPDTVPDNAQWLAGVGTGSWFALSVENQKYRIKRFSIIGDLECDRFFLVDKQEFNILEEYEFTYISHCKECIIIQNKITYKFRANEY